MKDWVIESEQRAILFILRGDYMKKLSKGMLMAAVITGTLFSASAYAAEEIQEFSLDPMVVTATRTEKRDIDVAASTEILTQKDIKASGATNAHVALQKLTGLTYSSFGPSGATMGTMTNAVTIRGVDSGTLVMVNGVPVSWRAKYNLESISAENIEKIEVVKGSGSVLYGSEAVAGVINIITKKKGTNSVTTGIGNFGRKKYGVSAGNEKFGISYNKEKMDHAVTVNKSSSISSTKDIGNTRTDTGDVRRENIAANYNVNDRLSLSYSYNETEARYERFLNELGSLGTTNGLTIGQQYNSRLYTTKQHIGQIKYEDNSWKAVAFINDGTVESEGPTLLSSTTGKPTSTGKRTSKNYYNTRERNRTYGTDIQRNFKINDKIDAIVGLNYKHEAYKSCAALSTSAPADYSRDNWGLYGQWDQKFDDKNEMIISGRYTTTANAFNDQNYNNFSAAGQYIHKLDNDTSIYASVAQSFVMPTFANMYKEGEQQIPNPDLKPQKGTNYEIGWKKAIEGHSWKAAIYNVRIKDNISASWDKKTTEWTYTNEHFKNYGFEFSHKINQKNGWNYSYGLNLQNPRSKNTKKPYWDRKYGKVQLNGGIGYTYGKLNTNLQASYLAERVQTPSAEHSYDAKPYLLTTLTAIYAPDKNSEFSLVVDNLLDRDDITSHSSSAYRATPANFMVNYTYKF